MGCEEPLLVTTDWQRLIEHIALLAGLSEDASAAFLLRASSAYERELQAKTEEMHSALLGIKFGAASLSLPPPPSQELFDKSAHLQRRLDSFQAAIVEADEDAVLAAGEDLLVQVTSIQADYVRMAVARHPTWPGTRVQVASWQTVLAKKIFKEVLLSKKFGRPNGLDATLAQFEDAHERLRHGGGGLPAIIKERPDLYEQWQKVDPIWASLKKQAIFDDISPGTIHDTVRQLEEELHVLVLLCSVEDVPSPEKGPGPVVACFAVLSGLLVLCACCGPFLESRLAFNSLNSP